MSKTSGRRDGGSNRRQGKKGVKDVKAKKRKPIREESFPAESVFQANDFSYIDAIVDPNRSHRSGPKGYPPSSMFMALLLMYLKEIRSILDLVRFLSANPEWLRMLGLKKRVDGVEIYSVPDRTRFYRFARRVGIDGMMEILSVMVVRLMKQGIIKGGEVSLDATIISAWFKDCRARKDERHLKVCRQAREIQGQGRLAGLRPPQEDIRLRLQGPRPPRLADRPAHGAHNHHSGIRGEQGGGVVRLDGPEARRQGEKVLCRRRVRQLRHEAPPDREALGHPVHAVQREGLGREH